MERYVIQDQDLAIADGVARTLHKKKTDVNELLKCIGFLRDLARDKRDGVLFFEYLDTVIADGRPVMRSDLTLDYYHAIRDACNQHLTPYEDNPDAMAQILGWAARLMRYYAVESKLSQQASPPRQARQRTSPSAAVGNRQNGTVKFFKQDSGYGFIQPDSGGRNQRDVAAGSLRSGQRVSYQVAQGQKGPQARDVQPE
jgi:cold shock CspA family protein